MYSIDSTNKKIVFTFSKSALFEDLKRTSAHKAQQIVSKEGTDLSDMYIITDGERSYLDKWLDATLPMITSALPQQHLTTAMDSTSVTITAYADTTREMSEGNILSADGILRNLLLFGCLAEWYSETAHSDFQQEYAVKLGENIRLFASTLWDSRKRKVGTLFSTTSGSIDNAKTYAAQIETLETLLAALQAVTAAQGTTIASHTSSINSQGSSISSLTSRVSSAEGDISNETTRAQTAEQGILNTVQEWISESLAKLTVKVNGSTVIIYDPNDTNSTLTLTIPTAVAQLSDAGSYSTTAQVTALIAAAITAFAGSGGTLSTILADYALKSWVTSNFAPIGGGGGGTIDDYVDLSSDQYIEGVKTFRDIKVTGSMAIPTSAPSSPSANTCYLWYNSNGYYYGEDSGSGSGE